MNKLALWFLLLIKHPMFWDCMEDIKSHVVVQTQDLANPMRFWGNLKSYELCAFQVP